MKPTPCYFRSISLTNIKSFGSETQTLSFQKPSGELAQWTLLLGDNGLGKTTILQCLTEVTANLARPIERMEEGAIKQPIAYLPRLIGSRKSLGNLPYSRVDQQTSKVRTAFIEGIQLGRRMVKTTGEEPSDIWFQMENGVLSVLSGVSEDYSTLQPIAYGTFRRSGPTKFDGDLNPDSCATLFNDDSPLINVEEWLLRADYAAAKSKDTKSKKRLENIKELLVDFLPEVTAIRIPASGSDVPIPEAKTPDGWVPVKALSTGYRATMAWVTDFAARLLDRFPESTNPFAEPAVVLVDQIDTHLHPKWQRQLILDLSKTFPATQFIVTAHSPLMVQAMPEANIAVLRREGDHVVICNDPADVRGWRLDQIVASDLFEEQPIRDIDTQSKLEDRRKLLSKSKLTKPDQARLEELNDWATSIPTADAPEDIRAMEIIRRAAKKMETAQ